MDTFALLKYLYLHWDEIDNDWQLVLTALTSLLGAIVTLASLITPMTKTPQDDALLDKVKTILHQMSITNPRK